jgi:uncharacterized protein with HEPN domain
MRKDNAYLKDILDAITAIEGFVKNVSERGFYRNKEKQFAVLRALEIIGEAAKQLSGGLWGKYPLVPWKEMAGMRDKLIHGYFGVDRKLVWKTTKDKLPELKRNIRRIIKAEFPA